MTAAPFSDRVSSLASWRGELPRQLVEPLQRQLDVVKEIAEHERELQQQVAEQMVAPVPLSRARGTTDPGARSTPMAEHNIRRTLES